MPEKKKVEIPDMPPMPGDSNKITKDYFESLLVEQRVMGAVYPSTKMELFGETFDTPIMMAALSHLHRMRPNGMVEMAQGAYESGSVMWAGMGDNEEMKAILATGAKTIKIIKPYADEKEIFDRITFSEENGALAVGMDVDHAFGIMDAENMTVEGYPMKQKTLAELKSYVQATKLPFIIKGVLSVQDALRSAEMGCKGIVISHHHGIMRYAVPPLMVLPKIKAAVGDSMKIFVDCGVMNGFDAFKALALGADAVSVGRAIMPPLIEDGAEGVRQTVVKMNNQLMGMMARTDSCDLQHIDPNVIWHK